MRKLEIVQREVGGCLISYNFQLACVRKLGVSDQMHIAALITQIDNHESLSHLFTEVCIELLGQLQICKIIFRKRGGGRRQFGFFFENSSDLAQPSFP